MPKIEITLNGTIKECWGFPADNLRRCQIGLISSTENGRFDATRTMKSGPQLQTFPTQEAAEQWIGETDFWGQLI